VLTQDFREQPGEIQRFLFVAVRPVGTSALSSPERQRPARRKSLLASLNCED
jgi:hypothetical protein